LHVIKKSARGSLLLGHSVYIGPYYDQGVAVLHCC